MQPAEVEEISQKLELLYKTKDEFSGSSEAPETVKQVSELVTLIQNCLQSDNLDPKTRAYLHMLHGKSLNVLTNYQKDAEVSLTRAIKLDPTLTEAWIILGECFWKKNDLESAKNSFLGAIQQSKEPNKVCLRQLSMVLRSLPGDPATRKQNIEESLKTAKEAVALDVSDGMSWYILGNAFLASFFANTFQEDDLQKALKAYLRAELSPHCAKNPDLYFNRAKLHQFVEDFGPAIQDFSKASELAPSWNEPKTEISEIISFVNTVTELKTKKGHLKAKRLQASIASVPTGSKLKPKLTPASVSSLQPGKNAQNIFIAKVVKVLNKTFPPVSVLVVDANGDFALLSIYNIGERGVKQADDIFVVQPQLEEYTFTYESKSYTYQRIKVDFASLIINDKPASSNDYAQTTLRIEKESKQ